MKCLFRCCSAAFVLVFYVLPVWAQPDATLALSRFFSAGNPTVELSLALEVESFKQREDKSRNADVLVLFSQNDSIRIADKINMVLPQGSSAVFAYEMLRYSLKPGNYKLSVEIIDPVDTSKTWLINEDLELASAKTNLALSDIQLMASMATADESNKQAGLLKNGFVFEPLIGNFVSKNLKGFVAYLEVFDPLAKAAGDAKPDLGILEYSLFKLDVPEGQEPEAMVLKTKRFERTLSNQSFQISINTASLRSGKYALKMVLRDRSLEALDQNATIFYVSNPETDQTISQAAGQTNFESSWASQIPEDSLDYILTALLPVATAFESTSIEGFKKNQDPESKRLLIFNHFYKQSADYPEVAFRSYMKVVREVDYAFRSGFGHGFQTDRGFVWLKYGAPNDRLEVNNDPSAPPYEIWIYNFVERTLQSPGKFLFYNPTNDNASYVLLHSTVRGEIFEPQWRRLLYYRSQGEYDNSDTVQGTGIGDNVGRYADQYFTDF